MKLLKILNYLCFGIVLSLILVLFNFVSDIYPDVEYNNPTHVTLYLDRNFDDFETETIMKAAWEWSEATNHIIEYDIVQLPTKDKMVYKNAVFIIKRSPDDPQILLLDVGNDNTTYGVYTRNPFPTISIVSERLTNEMYKEVVLHEMGHSLGLKHLEGLGNMDTLMFPYTEVEIDKGVTIPAGSDHITRKDLVLFCKLYKCDVDKLKN
jgi:predicted Zn-dependent protease